MNPKNYTIPTVCDKLGAVCVDNSKNTPSREYTEGFGCISFTELVYLEKLYEN